MRTLPALADKRDSAGSTADHYFQQDLHVARLIRAANPVRHVDVGSRIDGFIAHLLVFRSVEVVDVRPLRNELAGLTFVQGNAETLDSLDDDSVPSLSSLHAVEHFGLGRYGDPVRHDAHLAAMRSFQRVLSSGGSLYLSVPIGRPRVEFNAHRVFAPGEPMEWLRDLSLVRFDAIGDDQVLVQHASPADFVECAFGLGIYVFVKA